MIHPNTEDNEKDSPRTSLKKFEEIEKGDGKLKKSSDEQKLMNSVMENDKETIDDGKLINDAVNQGMGNFMPDMMFENISKNFSMAKKMYGETVLRQITGYSPDYLKKNVSIPEFKRELKENIEKNVEKLKDKNLIDKKGKITEKAFNLASILLYTQELDHLVPEGIRGQKFNKHKTSHGERGEIRNYKPGLNYKDISVRKSINTAVRRGHSQLVKEDLKFHNRVSKGQIYMVYAIDSSGSMNGKKIEMAKKAGIALSFKATEERDKVGLMIFGTEIKEKIEPTTDFWRLLKAITKTRAGKETNITKTIDDSVELFPTEDYTKHLTLITDAMPNIGKEPESETIMAAARARNKGITISIIGIGLEKEGEQLAKKIVEAGEGKLYLCKKSDNVDSLILEDYYSL